jgi:shikimate kinase
MNIVLIGYRGSGKTSIGKRLAVLRQMSFVDTDALIIETAGRTIKEIFATEGEPGFRDRESAAIQEISQRQNAVIAVGGGAILRPENVAALKKIGRIIWLQADPETLHARILADAATFATRPNLTAAGGLEEIRALLETRLPLYASAADTTLDISAISIEEAANQLHNSLEQSHLP